MRKQLEEHLPFNCYSEHKNRFFYDDLNQLIREDNRAAKRTVVYDYDDAGNIIRKRIWNVKYIDATPENDYSELGTPSYDYAYTYGNSEWGEGVNR